MYHADMSMCGNCMRSFDLLEGHQSLQGTATNTCYSNLQSFNCLEKDYLGVIIIILIILASSNNQQSKIKK